MTLGWSGELQGQLPPGYTAIPTDPAKAFNWDAPDRFRWVLTTGGSNNEPFKSTPLSDAATLVYRGHGWSCLITATQPGRMTWAADNTRYFKEQRFLICSSTKGTNKVMVPASCTSSPDDKMFMSSANDLYLGSASTPVDFDSMYWLQLKCEVWVDSGYGEPPDGKVQEREWQFCNQSQCKM